MADPNRPRTLEDLFIGLIASQDDSGQTDTQLFDVIVMQEVAGTTDALAFSTNATSPYRYNDAVNSKYNFAFYS